MIALHNMATAWPAWIGAASWQLAVLVCLVAIICQATKGASPRLRHGLWLLVLIKALLPPSLSVPWSLGRWSAPMMERLGLPARGLPLTTTVDFTSVWQTAAPSPVGSAWPLGDGPSVQAMPLMLAWLAGVGLFWAAIAWRYQRLWHVLTSASPLDEGPVRVTFEQLGLDLGLRRVPDLLTTRLTTSPFLCGVLRPCVVLPEKTLVELNPLELRAVLAHELVHFQRGDTWIGWLQLVVQSLFWFHPLVWFANRQLRHQRECACDEGVLRLNDIPAQEYGETIVRVLTASRGRSLVAGNLVGVFERGGKLQERLEEIMSCESGIRTFGWSSRLFLAAAAVLLLPMADSAADKAAAPGPPQIVKSIPQMGATGVDPALKEITVTFDREMTKGMSWTGGPPSFPPMDDSRQAQWVDPRTCILPVKLAAGSYYRVGVNSATRLNFKAADGTPAAPAVINFTTKGADAAAEGQLRAPLAVTMQPNNGAQDVDPKLAELRVTFNMPMGEGMSWVGGGPSFPKLTEGAKAAWSADGLTCTLPVTLEPGHEYVLGLNSKSHINFQSTAGVPLAPVVYKFRTRGAP